MAERAATPPQNWRFTAIAGAAGAIMLAAALLIGETAPKDVSEPIEGEHASGSDELPADIARMATRETLIAQIALRDPKFLDAAVRSFREAAEHGDPVAATYLGYLYYMGKGVPQDDRFAMTWYTAAAVANIPEAQLRLALMNLQGRSLAPDELEAIRWLRSVAEKGKAAAIAWPTMLDSSDPAAMLKNPPASVLEKLKVARGYLRARVAQGDRISAELLCFSFEVHRDDPAEQKRWCTIARRDRAPDLEFLPLAGLGTDPFALLRQEPFRTR